MDKVKVLVVDGADQVQTEINKFLNENKGVTLKNTSMLERDGKVIVNVTYSEKPNLLLS
jgi:uncharacterized protein YkuJ